MVTSEDTFIIGLMTLFPIILSRTLELRTRVVTCREIGLAKWKIDDILQNTGKYSGDTEFFTKVKFKEENKICKRIICLSIVDMFV